MNSLIFNSVDNYFGRCTYISKVWRYSYILTSIEFCLIFIKEKYILAFNVASLGVYTFCPFFFLSSLIAVGQERVEKWHPWWRPRTELSRNWQMRACVRVYVCVCENEHRLCSSNDTVVNSPARNSVYLKRKIYLTHI